MQHAAHRGRYTHGSCPHCPVSRTKVTGAKLSMRVTSKGYFIVHIFSTPAPPTKTEPTNRSKGQSFLALWEPQGTAPYRNTASTGTKCTNTPCPASPVKKGYREKHFKSYILMQMCRTVKLQLTQRVHCIISCRK